MKYGEKPQDHRDWRTQKLSIDLYLQLSLDRSHRTTPNIDNNYGLGTNILEGGGDLRAPESEQKLPEF